MGIDRFTLGLKMRSSNIAFSKRANVGGKMPPATGMLWAETK